MKEIRLSTGRIAELACLLEVSAAKPGNVHRGADFEDTAFEDFLASAVVLGQAVDETAQAPIGKTIHYAVEQTREIVGTNTNLGMVLLIVPLAKAAATGSLNRQTVRQVLDGMVSDDAMEVYSAIRLAQPGGLGTVDSLDVEDSRSQPTDLLEGMRLAQDRDLVARQYVNGFEEVFQTGVPLLIDARERFQQLSQAIIVTHVSMMARYPDSLIARKCGPTVAQHAQMLASKAVDCLASRDRAAAVTDPGPMVSTEHSSTEQGSTEQGSTEQGSTELRLFWECVGELDFWLRSDGHRRNPGTTADLIAASLFVAIQTGKLQPPFK